VVHFTIDARRVLPEGASGADEDATAKAGEGVARVDPATKVKVGDRITFAVNTEGMQFCAREPVESHPDDAIPNHPAASDRFPREFARTPGTLPAMLSALRPNRLHRRRRPCGSPGTLRTTGRQQRTGKLAAAVAFVMRRCEA
jgi:hypothetical protein